MNEETPGASANRTLLDIADLIHFLARHGIVSGIQRVIIETIREVDSRGWSGLKPVAYDDVRQTFAEVDEDAFHQLIGALGQSESADAVRSSAEKMLRQTRTARHVAFTAGDVLLVLGAAWNMRGYYHEVSSAKRHGCKVVNLVYDLIPGYDDSFPRPLSELFRTYLEQLCRTADRVPCISAATRRDFEEFTASRGLPTPPGNVTTLPGGMSNVALAAPSTSASWPYVLMVGTIEGRKGHDVAFRAWQRLRHRLGADRVPRLVVVGRWGWNVHDFVDSLIADPETAALIDLRTDFVDDAELAGLFANCLFTIYPSRKEGWGLPVSESLDFGKAVIAAECSSIPEAGGDLALYMRPDSDEDLADLAEKLIIDDAYRGEVERNIRQAVRSTTWAHVADVLMGEVAAARLSREGDAWLTPIMGAEYPLGVFKPIDAGYNAKQYFDAHMRHRRLPLTGAIGDVRRLAEAQLMAECRDAMAGPFGLRLRRGRRSGTVTIEFTRPSDKALHVYLGAVSSGRVTTDCRVNGHHVPSESMRGLPVQVSLPSGPQGEHIRLEISLRVASWRRLGIVSFLFCDADDAAVQSEIAHSFARARFLLADRDLPVTDREALTWARSTLTWRLGGPFRVAYRRMRRWARVTFD